MLHFQLEPQFSSSWIQRLVDRFCFGQGNHHIPILGAEEGNLFHLDTPIPQDAGLLVPSKPPQKPECQRNDNSQLLQLPVELLVHTMLYLPYSSLYMVRQTCQVLRNLTDDFQFECFKWEILQHENRASLTTLPICDELRSIRRTLLRRSLCMPCGKLFDSGRLEAEMRKLWQRVHCTGCKTQHPELLFPQGGREDNICVGLLGKFAPCKHVNMSGKVEVHKGNLDLVCSHPDHFPADGINSEELPAFKQYRPRVKSGSYRVTYSRSFPLVKIAPQQYPEIPALRSRLLRQLREQDGLCQHASTQLDSIVSCLPWDKCYYLPSSGPPLHQSHPTHELQHWCDNHGYNCRDCGARYFWFHENDYIVLRVLINLANWGVYTMGWLSNITFHTDVYPIHPILNESTRGVLWCTDPSCGTGYGNRWLLMVEILKRVSLRRVRDYSDVPSRNNSFVVNLPFTLEYQVFQHAAGWMTEPGMLEDDLLSPLTNQFLHWRT